MDDKTTSQGDRKMTHQQIKKAVFLSTTAKHPIGPRTKTKDQLVERMREITEALAKQLTNAEVLLVEELIEISAGLQ